MKTEMKVLLAVLSALTMLSCGLIISDNSEAYINPEGYYEEVYKPVDITGKDGQHYYVKFAPNFSAKYKGENAQYRTSDIDYLGVKAFLVPNEKSPIEEGKVLPVLNVTPGEIISGEQTAVKNDDINFVIENFIEFLFNVTIVESDGTEGTYSIPGVADLLIKKEPLGNYLHIDALTYNSTKQAPTKDDIKADVDLYDLELFKNNKNLRIGDIIDTCSFTKKLHANTNKLPYYVGTVTIKDAYADYFSEGKNPIEVKWTMNPASLVDDVYNVHFESLIYNGSPQAPKTLYVTFKSNDIEVGIDNKDKDHGKGYTVISLSKETNAGSYPATVRGNTDYKDDWTGQFFIEKKAIDKEWVSIIPNQLEYTGKLQDPTSIDAKISVVDPSINYEIPASDLIIDFTKIKDPGYGDTEITVKDDCPNYYGFIAIYGDDNNNNKLDKNEWEIIEPIPLAGEIHVNLIYTKGELTGKMFDDTNTFIYPYSNTYTKYDENGKLRDDGPQEIHRENYLIVVLDANGKVVIDEVNPSLTNPTETTSSEWNHIELYGTKGYTGCITGSFYVSFDDPVNHYTIGSTITDNNITYTVTSLDNKTVSVTGYEEGIASELVIPDFVNGFKVTKIADKAFYGCKTITSIKFGDYVTSVGVKAFTNCTKLQSVEFEDSLKTISAYAFYGCTRLADISMDNSVKTIGSYAFYKCTALKTINISGALKTLGGNAFSVSFIDADGKGITQTAKNLAGHTFKGSNKVLKLVA